MPISTQVKLEQIDYSKFAYEPYTRRGILHSEMALILYLCRSYKVQCVIDSGRAQGQSVYMLAKYLPHCFIISIELRPYKNDDAIARERLKQFNNVLLLDGNAFDLVPKIVEKIKDPMAILCDGPKGHQAIRLLRDSFQNPRVRIGFIHDMRRLDNGLPSPYREAAETIFPNHLFSDEPSLIRSLAPLDQYINFPAGPEHEREYGSYGPTIGAFVNSKQQ